MSYDVFILGDDRLYHFSCRIWEQSTRDTEKQCRMLRLLVSATDRYRVDHGTNGTNYMFNVLHVFQDEMKKVHVCRRFIRLSLVINTDTDTNYYNYNGSTDHKTQFNIGVFQ